MAKNSPQDLENREYFSNNLNRLMKEKGVRQIDLHYNLSIPKSTITGYVKGTSLPTAGNVQKIADYLGVKKSDLDIRFKDLSKPTQDASTPNINALTSTVKDLEESRVLNVLDYAKAQLDEQQKATSLTVEEPATLYKVHGTTKAAAGLGYGFDDYDTYTVYTDEEPPYYDLATMVDGDSMEPEYQDGEMLYLRDTGVRNFSGELCVVAVNDKTYFKKVYLTSDGLRLVSLNPAYEDIYIDFPPTDNDTHIKIFTVIDSFVPVKP